MKKLLSLAVVVLLAVVIVSALEAIEAVNACAPGGGCIEGVDGLNEMPDQGTFEDQGGLFGSKALLRASTRISPANRIMVQAGARHQAGEVIYDRLLDDGARRSVTDSAVRRGCIVPGSIQEVRNRMRKTCRSIPRIQVN